MPKVEYQEGQDVLYNGHKAKVVKQSLAAIIFMLNTAANVKELIPDLGCLI